MSFSGQDMFTTIHSRNQAFSQPMSGQSLDFFPGAFTTSPYSGSSVSTAGNSYSSTFGTFAMDSMDMLDGQTVVDDTFSFINFDGSSSGTSQPPSHYDGYDDGEKYISSPITSTMPMHGIPSMINASCLDSYSPEIMPRTTSPMNDFMDEDSDESMSDQFLDSLITNVTPRRNQDGEEIYHCVDARAMDHACDYFDKRRCNLRKHLEATLRTNVCRHPDCKMAAFSSKAVLTRHEKESHGMHQAEQFFCPVDSCERHLRPFPREYNMCDHITRVHKEIDVNTFMKKSRKSKKPKSGSITTRSSGHATPVGSKIVDGSRKSASNKTRARIEKMERAYDETLQQSRQMMDELYCTDRSDYANKKRIKKLRETLSNLDDHYRALIDFDND